MSEDMFIVDVRHECKAIPHLIKTYPRWAVKLKEKCADCGELIK
jgi:hypothetical protein